MLMTRKKILDSVPRYRPVLQDEPEFFSVGHDGSNPFVGFDQLNGDKDLAVLACGIGDARVLYATIVCAAMVAPESTGKKLHFTLVDVKPAVFARDLLVFHMLVAMRSQDDEKREETSWAIAYVFAGQVMPAWAYETVRESISALITTLEDVSNNVMDIFYVSEPSRAKIIHVLKQWQEPPVDSYTAVVVREMTAEQLGAHVEAYAETSGNGTTESFNPKLPPGCQSTDSDARLFKDFHVVLPSPYLLERHEPDLLLASRAYLDSHSPSDRKTLDDYINSTWKPNITVIDFDFERKCKNDGILDGQPCFDWSPREVVLSVFAALPPHMFLSEPGLFEHISAFFRGVSGSLSRLGDRVVIEVIAGEMHDALERLRYGLLRYGQKTIGNLDPSKFPNRFDKIDMSNIPDYVGGSLTSFLHGIPLLREERRSCLRSYVLLNLYTWDSHDEFLAEFLILGDRRVIESHFRTTLTQLSQFYEARNAGLATPVGSMAMGTALGWERTASPSSHLPLEHRMPRPKLETWLHFHFLKLCLPFPRERSTYPCVNDPLNLTTFLHVISHVASLGYPLDWLSDILRELCSGVLTQTLAEPPMGEIKLEVLAREDHKPIDYSVAPFAAEFRTLLAIWEPALGVPLTWNTPVAGKKLLPESTMIRKFTVQFPKEPIKDTNPMDACFGLVMKKRSLETPGQSLVNLLDSRWLKWPEFPEYPDLMRARREPYVHLVSACKFDPESFQIEFWLDEREVDRLVAETGWEAWIWRTDDWVSVMGPVSLDSYGDLVVKGEAWSSTP
ncbi:unnamed protein product [Clonostachys rosea]|uniref:DUF4470 domain-containing protein n=1 Tax=Bionectria ochroleuca TaxID=29856 RepID=A0ABY6UGF3_BIOOC|nr:unnamed protein product [Clonostachys rosea]